MSGVPRSQRLLHFASTAAANSPIWVSPAGYITLVKSLHMENFGTVSGEVRLIAGADEGGQSIVMIRQTVEPASTHIWEGWFVCNPGDGFYIFLSVADLVVWCSGAVLAGTNQFPPATRELPAQQPHG